MDFTVSFGNNIKDPNDITAYRSLKEILEYQSYSEKLEWQIEDIRGAETKEERKKLKTHLPYIIGSHFEPENRHASNLKQSNLMIFDVDGLNEDEVEPLFEKLAKERFVVFVFRSPSGNGLKFGVGLQKMITDHELFPKVYKYAKKFFEEYYEIALDKTSDCSRACFLSYDENYYYNDSPRLFPVKFEPEKQPVYTEKDFTTELDSIDQEEEFQIIADICRKISISDYNDWITAGMALKTIYQGEELFLMLSMGKGYKDSASTVRYKFRTFASDGAVTIKSFFHIAKKYDYDVSGAYKEAFKKLKT